MEPRTWFMVGGVIASLVAVIVGMSALNVSSAIEACEKAGYEKPDWSLNVTACPADESYSYDSVALVVGNVASSPKPELTAEMTNYLLNSYAHTEGKLKPFIYSATPGGYQLDFEDKKTRRSGNVNSFIRNSSTKLESISEAITQPPVEDNVDYFNNIVTAARAVKSSPRAENSLVLVVGSGLSDSQPLNFAQSDLLHAEPTEIINTLRQDNSIIPGELSGVQVIWSGLGVTSPPQQPLDSKEKGNLKRIYTTVFQQLGASISFDDTLQSRASIDTNHTVNNVEVTGTQGGVTVFKLGEDSIGFRQYTADIIDEAVANEALKGVVQNYQTCPAATVTVEGYQALAKDEEVQEYTELSQSRADEVRRLLVAQGINEAQITALGRGSGSFEGRVNEVDPSGTWSESEAQKNRVVLIKMDGTACGS